MSRVQVPPGPPFIYDEEEKHSLCTHVRRYVSCESCEGARGSFKIRQIIVGLNSDEVIAKKKGRLPILSFSDRKRVLDSVKYVDHVIKVDDYLSELEKHSNLTIFHGDDWSEENIQIVSYLCKKNGGKLILLPYGDGINSTKIRNLCKQA